MNYIYLLMITTIWNCAAGPHVCPPPDPEQEAAIRLADPNGPKSSVVKSVEVGGYYKTEEGCTRDLLKQSAVEAALGASIAKSGVTANVAGREFECKLQKLGP